MAYAADRGWALVHEPGLLVVHAGADELFAIEDVGDETAHELLTLWRDEVLHPERLSAEASDVFEQLKSAGIVRNRLARRDAYALQVRFVGPPDGDLEAQLADALPEQITLRGGEGADLLLLVRTGGAFADIAAEANAGLSTPHLLLDLAYGHTICLGPLVFSGETACLACLVGRVTHAWGDAEPPPRPRMTRPSGLSAGLVALAIENILLREDRGLVNRTVAYDFAVHGVQAHSLYRLPMCAVCGADGAPRTGFTALPWVGAR